MHFKRKVAIIGVGRVGSTTAFALATQGICNELVLIDTNMQKAEGDAIDIEDAVSHFSIQLKVKVNDYADADLVIFSAGANSKTNQSRLDTLVDTKAIVKDVIPKLVNRGFNGIFLNITNPCDIITYDIWKTSGFSHHKVLGTGTGLDSSRLQKILAKMFDVAPRSIESYCMGEHGDSQMVPWSHVHIGGKCFLDIIKNNKDFNDIDLNDLVHQVAYAGWEVLLRKGAVYFSIASVAADIVHAIFNAEDRVLPVSAYLQGEYGLEDIYIGVPAVIGSSGVKDIVEFNLTQDELQKFHYSAQIIKSYIRKLD